jgi:hypothetical protein
MVFGCAVGGLGNCVLISGGGSQHRPNNAGRPVTPAKGEQRALFSTMLALEEVI